MEEEDEVVKIDFVDSAVEGRPAAGDFAAGVGPGGLACSPALTFGQAEGWGREGRQKDGE